MAGYIRMPFGRDVGLGPDDIELDGDPTPPGKGALQHFSAHFSARVRVNCGPCLLWPTVDTSGYHLVHR